MDTSRIARPDELPFDVPEMLKRDIDALIAALERDDCMLDCYLDEVEGSARCLDIENDMRIRRYYVHGGWQSGGFK